MQNNNNICRVNKRSRISISNIGRVIITSTGSVRGTMFELLPGTHFLSSISLPPVLLLWVDGGQGTNGRTRTINTVQRQLYSYSAFCCFSSSVIQFHVPLVCGTIRKYYSSSPTLSYPPLLGVGDTHWSHSGSVPVLMPPFFCPQIFPG